MLSWKVKCVWIGWVGGVEDGIWVRVFIILFWVYDYYCFRRDLFVSVFIVNEISNGNMIVWICGCFLFNVNDGFFIYKFFYWYLLCFLFVFVKKCWRIDVSFVVFCGGKWVWFIFKMGNMNEYYYNYVLLFYY